MTHFASDRNPPISGLSRKKVQGWQSLTDIMSVGSTILLCPTAPVEKESLSFFKIVRELINVEVRCCIKRVYMLFSLLLHMFKILYFKQYFRKQFSILAQLKSPREDSDWSFLGHMTFAKPII